MPRLIKAMTSKKAGLAPGTLVHVGEKKAEHIKITLTDYDADEFRERKIEDIEEVFPLMRSRTATWLNIDGLHDTGIIEKIGTRFSIHPLVLEDIVNTGQRAKLEDYEDYLFIVFKMLYFDPDEQTIKSEQISLILFDGLLISFQEIEGDVFNTVRERIQRGKGRIRKMGCDYLAYTLIDATIDQYFSILDKMGEKIEQIEDEISEDPSPEISKNIHQLKREMIHLRKQIWPMREMVSALQKGDSVLIGENLVPFLMDIYDHTVQVIDTVETFRDMLSGLLEVYLSTISNRMNEVMKVLTVIATLFIPLTFLTGVYGMNFKYMPELEWRWAYFALWSIMAVIAAVMLFYFKKKNGCNNTPEKGGPMTIGKDKGWNPYLTGALAGIVMILSVWIAGKFFGASTTFVRSAGMIEQMFSAERVAKMDYFVKTTPKVDWQWMFVVGIFIGSLISATTSRSFYWQALPDMWQRRFGQSRAKRGIVAFVGGAVAMFGARLAGG